MADFTPGPWEAGPNPQGLYSNDWVVRPAGEFPHGEWIADVGAGTTDATRRANARLIAAAPEMYEALKAIIGFFESGEFVRDTSRDFEQGWHLKMLPVVKSIADAQAALKKAEAH